MASDRLRREAGSLTVVFLEVLLGCSVFVAAALFFDLRGARDEPDGGDHEQGADDEEGHKCRVALGARA